MNTMTTRGQENAPLLATTSSGNNNNNEEEATMIRVNGGEEHLVGGIQRWFASRDVSLKHFGLGFVLCSLLVPSL